MTVKKEPKNSNVNKWLLFMGIPFQLGIVIFLFTYLGIWVDGKYTHGTTPWFTIGLSLFSVFVGLYNVIRQVNNINKNNK